MSHSCNGKTLHNYYNKNGIRYDWRMEPDLEPGWGPFDHRKEKMKRVTYTLARDKYRLKKAGYKVKETKIKGNPALCYWRPE